MLVLRLLSVCVNLGAFRLACATEAEDLKAGQRMQLTPCLDMLDAWALELQRQRGDFVSGSERKRVRYNSTLLLESPRMSRQLIGGAKAFVPVMGRARSIMEAQGATVIQTPQHMKCPQKTTLDETNFALDCAFMLQMQQMRAVEQSKQQMLRYFWADSSPQKNHDWLWLQYTEISTDTAVLAFSAVLELCSLVNEVPLTDLNSYVQEVPDAWRLLLDALPSVAVKHCSPPGSVANGQRGVVHKVACILHSLALELPDQSYLLGFLRSAVSFTSDMGVELSVPDFRTADATALMPPWYDHSMELDVDQCFTEAIHECEQESPAFAPDVEQESPAFAPDVETDDVDVTCLSDTEPAVHVPIAQAMVNEDAREASTHLMPNALTVAGIQHVIHNLLKDVSTEMSGWTRFRSELGVVDAFLYMQERRTRYISTCLKGTVFECHEASFYHWSQSLYEQRWHQVVTFLMRLQPIFPILRKTWNHSKYIHGVDTAEASCGDRPAKAGAGRHFDAVELTRVLHSAWFSKYMAAVLWLESVPEALAVWCERCPCHDAFYRIRTSVDPNFRLSQARLFSHHFGKGCFRCPMAGKRAPELAAGALLEHIQVLWQDCFATVLLGDHGPGDTTDLEEKQLHDDIEICRASIHVQLKAKLGFYNRLPWYLFSLAHVSECVARQCAMHAVAMYSVDSRPGAHHRITEQLLRPGTPFRLCLDRFISGEARCTLPAEFVNVVASCRFVPVAETTIEAKHSKVAKIKEKLGPARVSLCNRMGEIEKLLDSSKEAFAAFVQLFDQARQSSRLAGLLNISGHPDLLQKCRRSFKLTKIMSIVYRVDVHALYTSMAHHTKQHEKHQDLEARAHKRLRATAQPQLALDTMELQERACLMDHFKWRAQSSAVYSLPANAVTLHPLASFLSAIDGKDVQSAVDFAPDNDNLEDNNAEVDTGDHDDDQDPSRPIFFRIVHNAMGSKKYMPLAPGSGQNLHGTMFAITLHSKAKGLGADVIEALPTSWCDEAGSDPITLLTELSNVPVIHDSLMVWQTRPGLHWYFPQCLQDAAAASAMFRRGAAPGLCWPCCWVDGILCSTSTLL